MTDNPLWTDICQAGCCGPSLASCFACLNFNIQYRASKKHPLHPGLSRRPHKSAEKDTGDKDDGALQFLSKHMKDGSDANFPKAVCLRHEVISSEDENSHPAVIVECAADVNAIPTESCHAELIPGSSPLLRMSQQEWAANTKAGQRDFYFQCLYGSLIQCLFIFSPIDDFRFEISNIAYTVRVIAQDWSKLQGTKLNIKWMSTGALETRDFKPSVLLELDKVTH